MKEITNTSEGRVTGSYHQELGKAVAAETDNGGFFAAILAGLLLGLGLDTWLQTRPVFIILGIITGFVTGFWKMWQVSNR